MAEERFLTETKHQRFRPYPKYKDSGVEWLGEIPAHWIVKKIKRLCLVRRGASPRPIDDPIYFAEDGEYAWVRIADVTASDRYLEQTTQRLSPLGVSKSVLLEPGELFVSIAATVGKAIITKIKCCIHDGFVYFVGLRENRDYLYYLFSCGEAYKGIGKLGTQLNLNTDTIGDIYLPVPCPEEQSVITTFLDRETAKIDALVAKRERLIELLQEKRTALITQAVTKGLDPNVPMKDSGIEWLGDVPIAWNLLRLKHIVQFLGGGTPSKDNLEYWQGDIPWVSPKDMKSWIVSDTVDKITEEAVAGSATKVVGPDTVLIVVRSGILNHTIPVALSGSEVALNQDLKALKAQAAVVPEYLAYFIAGMQSPLLFAWRKEGATVESLELDLIANTLIPLPPVSQQRIIVNYLKRETATIDVLTAKINVAIEHLKEYRTALISAAVTGKIDVRDEVRW